MITSSLSSSSFDSTTAKFQLPFPRPLLSSPPMPLPRRLQEIRDGFERPFWVANISEIFERLSYYGAFSSLALYLHEKLNFSTEQTGTLAGIFGGAVWFLAIFGGTVADWLGFRRALSLAYLILSGAYFLLGSIGSSWLSPIRNAMPLGLFVAVVLLLPALGISLVKPSVFAMVFFVLVFFREPKAKEGAPPPPSLVVTAKNFITVLSNPKFMLFLLIFTGYWIVFWQQFTLLPGYIHTFIDPHARVERVLSIDAAVVICFTLAWNHLIRKIPPFRAVILGTLVSALSWLILAWWPTYWGAVLSIFILALGEITQAPKYYEYISKLAPAEQQGTYMGFAFLPIGIGSIVGGWFGGKMLHHFGELQHQPQRTWYAITAVGVLTAFLLWIYDRVVKPEAQS